MKNQVIIIGGGDTFETYEEYLDFLHNYEIDIERYKKSKDDWKPWLRKKLGEDYEVIIPVMPNKTNAKFEEWKIWFEKFIPFFDDEVMLVGHSMGGAFLVKYLSNNTFPKKIKGVFLVSAVYDRDTDGCGLASFALPERFNLQTETVYLYHSKDDPVVPFSALENYQKALPKARARVFNDRKHFNQEEFPELVDDLVGLAN
jgi:hypothetical protein